MEMDGTQDGDKIERTLLYKGNLWSRWPSVVEPWPHGRLRNIDKYLNTSK